MIDLDALRTLIKDAVREVIREERASAPDEFMTTREAASFVRVSLATIRDWVDAGHLTRYSLSTGGKLRVRKAELVAYLEKSKDRAREETPEEAARRMYAEGEQRRRERRARDRHP